MTDDSKLQSDPVIAMARTKVRMGQSLTQSEQDYLKKYGKSDPFRPLDGPRHINLGRWKGERAVSGCFMRVPADVWDRIYGNKARAKCRSKRTKRNSSSSRAKRRG